MGPNTTKNYQEKSSKPARKTCEIIRQYAEETQAKSTQEKYKCPRNTAEKDQRKHDNMQRKI